MDGILQNFTDAYARKARLYPACVAFLPVIIAILIFTEWFDFEVKNALVIAVSAAVLYWLTSVSRQLGKAKEEALVREWSHLSSVVMLRHRDHAIDRYTKERYHRAAENLVPGLVMPTAEAERKDPVDADEKYQSVTKFLLAQTRDPNRYDLLLKENISYGFQRNLLGLKPLAITIAVGVIAYAITQDWDRTKDYLAPDGKELTVIIFALTLIFGWVVNVTKRSVQRVAEAYARRLLETLETQKM